MSEYYVEIVKSYTVQVTARSREEALRKAQDEIDFRDGETEEVNISEIEFFSED